MDWISSVSEYAVRAGAAPGCCVPVLRPERGDQAVRWYEILRTQFDGAIDPVAGERLVLAWGARASAAAKLYAAMSSSRLVVCSDVEEIVSAIAGSAEPNVVVVGVTESLTVSMIVRISTSAAESGMSVGFLCGRDQPGLAFSVAKALLRPRADLARHDVFDASSHRAEDDRRMPPEDLCRALIRPSLVKVLRSHGEGGHAKLPGVVVCGLPDPVEFPEAPSAGCTREPRNCKRAQPLDAAVVLGGELTAPVVCFLCCNGFNVAGELYPSSVSMALSLIEGWAAAVIAPIRPLIVSGEMMATLQRGLACGEPLGSVVDRLNELSGRIGQRAAFVLHGDPCLALPVNGECAHQAVSVAPPMAHDGFANGKLADLQDWLVLLLRQADQGRRLLRSAHAWLGDRAGDLLEPLTARSERIERLAVDALKWAESDPAGNSWQQLRRTATLIRLCVAQWDKEISRLMLALRDTLDPYDIGHYDQVRAEIQNGGSCDRCETPTEIHVYGRGDHPTQQRVARLCLVCGPVSEHRAVGLALTVPASARIGTPGERFRLCAELSFPVGQPRVVDSAQLHLRFFDKANDRCVHEEQRTVSACDQTVEFDFALPADLGVDLHSVRLAAASGFDLAYARVRFASLPIHRHADDYVEIASR